ncbi:MAG: hypothetical protein ABWY77_05400, partial [Acidimicrobiia bacterium]
MSDDTMRETAAPAASSASTPTGAPTTAAPEAPGAPDGTAAPGTTPQLGPDGLPKPRRRRGSRGGRNRNKPASANANGAANGVTGDADDVDDDLPEHENDAIADRGLTSDDVAAVAMEDAGLVEPGIVRPEPATEPRPRVGDSRPAPKIGDSRPAPVAAPADGASDNGEGAGEGAPKRRRRRGGRGRGRGGAGGGAGASQGAQGGQSGGSAGPGRSGGGNGGRGQGQGNGSGARQHEVVRADMSFDDEPALELDDDVLERRRGRTRKGRPAGRYMMCVHVLEGGHTHIAVLEGRNLVEHTLATPSGNESIDGNIYVGRVQNVLPGMEAAFVDIGTPKNAVLYRSDARLDDDTDAPKGRAKAQPKIEDMLKARQMIVCQVTKNPIAHKGARLTQEVSLPGRFVVLVPHSTTYGISKRLPDDERKRLRNILDKVRP